MTNDKKLVPDVRFKGFLDDWEQRKLGEVAKQITKGTTPKNKSGIGSIKFIKVENLLNGKISTNTFISEEEHLGYLKRSILEKDDILFSIAGTLGRVAIVDKEILPANTNQALAIIRNYTGEKEYLLRALISQTVQDFIKQNPSVGAQPNLSLQQIKELSLPIPSFSEQTKIGEFFSKVDSLITLQQEKIEKLKKLKVIYIYEFYDNYPIGNKRRLKSLLKKNTERNKDNLFNNVESISNKLGFVKQSDYFEDRIVASKDTTNYYVIRKNSFAYNPSRINVGSIAMKKDEVISIVSPLYVSFYTNSELDDTYLIYWFKSNNFKRQRLTLTMGGVRDTLSYESLTEMSLCIPSINIQKQVSKILTRLDLLIQHENKKLENLKLLKKEYLRKMFI